MATELLALFVHARDRRWVAWTPKGYYMASPGAESLIGWHVNRGWNEAAQFYPADRFRDQFNRPDIVKLVLETLDEEPGDRGGQPAFQPEAGGGGRARHRAAHRGDPEAAGDSATFRSPR